MWIVEIALSRPYTFIVLALLIFIMSPIMILRMPTDIFPYVNIPVVAVAWNYTALAQKRQKDAFQHSTSEFSHRPSTTLSILNRLR